MPAVIIVPLLAFAPGLFWLWYFYKKDRVEPEPLKEIRKCFLLGMAVALPASFLNDFISMISHTLFLVVSAPIVEESLKFMVVRKTVYESAEFDEPMDGVVYGAATALGFASIENLVYLGSTYAQGYQAFTMTVILRAFLTVPGHALWACIWGFALGVAKFSQPDRARKLLAKGLLLAIALHGLFNLLTLIGPLFGIGMLILTPLVWRLVIRRIQRAEGMSPHSATGGHTGKPDSRQSISMVETDETSQQ